MNVLQWIEEPDVWLLACIGLTWGIGSTMIESRSDLLRFSRVLAGAALILYCLYGIAHFRPTDAQEASALLVRALCANFLALGCVRMLLGIWACFDRYVIEPLREKRRRKAERAARALEAARAFLLPRPQPAPTVTVAKQEPKRLVERLRDKIIRERQRFDDRVLALIELKDLGGFDEAMMEELGKHETERYIRRVTDAVARDEID